MSNWEKYQITYQTALVTQCRKEGGEAIGADAPGGTFWRGGIFGHQCPENVDLQLNYSRVVDRRT